MTYLERIKVIWHTIRGHQTDMGFCVYCREQLTDVI